MLARYQRFFVFLTLAYWVGWVLYWWPLSPTIACSGIVLIMLPYYGTIGLQMVLMHRVNGRGHFPRASLGQLVRAGLREVWAAPQAFMWRQPFRSRAIADYLPISQKNTRVGVDSSRLNGASVSSPRGVILVHGIVCNRGFWNPWLRLLHAQRRPFIAVNLEPVFGSLDGYVATVDDAVQQITKATGRAPVLVGHSMGGMVIRAWLRKIRLKSPNANLPVHRIVTIAAPHHGTWLARFSNVINSVQMRPQSAWVQQLQADENKADYANFVCWYSNCDNIVFPPQNCQLEGADNRFIPSVAHVAMGSHPHIIQATLDLLLHSDAAVDS